VRSFWLWTVLGVALLGGCSSGGTAADMSSASQPMDDGRPAFCQGFCDGRDRCGQADPNCNANCLDQAQLKGIRPSALAAVGECARTEDCKTLELDNPTAHCFEKVQQAEPLRQAVIDYCESATLNYFRCNFWWSVEDCTLAVNAWQDDVLQRAQTCHLAACSRLFDCEKAIFEPMP
jgi:hypothetical protein